MPFELGKVCHKDCDELQLRFRIECIDVRTQIGFAIFNREIVFLIKKFYQEGFYET
jgi:hypothetical protein